MAQAPPEQKTAPAARDTSISLTPSDDGFRAVKDWILFLAAWGMLTSMNPEVVGAGVLIGAILGLCWAGLCPRHGSVVYRPDHHELTVGPTVIPLSRLLYAESSGQKPDFPCVLTVHYLDEAGVVRCVNGGLFPARDIERFVARLRRERLAIGACDRVGRASAWRDVLAVFVVHVFVGSIAISWSDVGRAALPWAPLLLATVAATVTLLLRFQAVDCVYFRERGFWFRQTAHGPVSEGLPARYDDWI